MLKPWKARKRRNFGGVPQAIVPDCAKAVINDPNRYEPDINPEYADFAGHYGCVILPCRPRHPKDKALVESMVRIIYSRIYARLRNRIFYSIHELNEAISELLEEHNNRPFQKMKMSRRELFEQEEKNVLKPLTEKRYEIKNFQRATVAFNYHVELRADHHYYSVPYQKKGREAKILYTDKFVEIYWNNERIALHLRDKRPYKYTTKTEHMPAQHAFYTKWTPERLINWAGNMGDGIR
jgi:hypothetical protein